VKRRTVTVVPVLVALLLGLYFLRRDLLPFVAYNLDVGDPPRRVDYVMALPGDSERRPFVAAAMANVGFADKLLIPKTVPSPAVCDGIVPPTFEVTRRIYDVRGISEDRVIVLDGETRSTVNDLDLLGEQLNKHPAATVGIVTNAFHTRRTRWTVRRRLPQHAERITVISAPNPGFEAATWWRSDKGFILVTSEYLKLAYYWFAYGNGVYWITSVAVVGMGLLTWKRKTKDARANKLPHQNVAAGRKPSGFTAPDGSRRSAKSATHSHETSKMPRVGVDFTPVCKPERQGVPSTRNGPSNGRFHAS